MKKLMKFLLKLAAVGAAIGGVFAYLKKKGYISVTTDHADEDLDDFSTPDEEGTERTYINIDTDAMKEKAKEMAQDAYDEAKKMADAAASNVADAVEKVWYKAEDTVEKVEEFFNDEEA